VSLYGFNPKGTELYSVWGCGEPDSVSATYYASEVNQKTGALGSPKQIFNYIDGSNGSDFVNITPSAVVYFSIPNTFNYGISSVNVYPLNGGPELFSCTASMLQACGYALSDTVDRTGKYVFLQASEDNTEITKLDFAQKKLIDTGGYVDGYVIGFSVDDALIYTQDYSTSDSPISIYTFNSATGAVSYDGSQITLPALPDGLIPALRQ
jgi:hypothetical protein